MTGKRVSRVIEATQETLGCQDSLVSRASVGTKVVPEFQANRAFPDWLVSRERAATVP